MKVWDVLRQMISPQGAVQEKSVVTTRDLEQVLQSWGYGSEAGVAVTEESAMRVATFYSCVRFLSEQIGMIPCILYRRLKGGGKERAVDHPYYRLMHNRPNSWQTPFQTKEQSQAHVLIRGTAYSYKNIVRGVTRELIPLHPARMVVNQADDLSLHYRYTNVWGKVLDFAQDQILRLPGLSDDGVRGLTPVAYMREALGLAMATQKYGAQLFKHGAHPGIGIKVQGKLTPEARATYREEIEETYGMGNWHRPLLLQEGADIVKVGMTGEDAQFLETRKFQRGEIISMFGIKPHKVGDLEHATYSNIEWQSLEHAIDTLMPWATRWEQALNLGLLTPREQEEYYFEFLLDALLRGDFKTRTEGYKTMIMHAMMTPNEGRGKENMNPEPGGDRRYMAANILPLDDEGVPFFRIKGSKDDLKNFVDLFVERGEDPSPLRQDSGQAQPSPQGEGEDRVGSG